MSDRAPWIQTYTGRRFYLFDPRPDDVHLDDIAWGLAHVCRFGGQCRTFYSVAQHSAWVAGHVPVPYAFHALLHDAAEAYVGDLVQPLKRELDAITNGAWGAIEKRIQAAILTAFDLQPLPYAAQAVVKRADLHALATERRDLMLPTSDEWDTGGETPCPKPLRPLGPQDAFLHFMATYDSIREGSRS